MGRLGEPLECAESALFIVFIEFIKTLACSIPLGLYAFFLGSPDVFKTFFPE